MYETRAFTIKYADGLVQWYYGPRIGAEQHAEWVAGMRRTSVVEII